MINGSVRIVEAEVAGTLYPLAFSLQAFAECHAKFGGIGETINAIDRKQTPEAILNTIWLFGMLNEWGVKYKKLCLGEEGALLPLNEAGIAFGITELAELEEAVSKAILEGIRREVEVEADSKNAETTPAE